MSRSVQCRRASMADVTNAWEPIRDAGFEIAGARTIPV
ncbi:hypothetical protein MMEU_0719 [Mycobacterium marinum str. Europe]|nr:hypothetical protein MMEU_0719 [Mycobacterium marinum str. Europe]